MAERWSFAANDVVEVDEFDWLGVDHCEECDGVVDDDQVMFEEGEAYCPGCYEDMFGA